MKNSSIEEYLTALAKYNFWESNVSKSGYYHKDYTDEIFDYTGNKHIKVLV